MLLCVVSMNNDLYFYVYRGLFLTRDVKEGEVLLRESAFAYSYYREGNIAVNLKANCYSDGSQLSTVTDLVIAATNNVS
jgi:hypothetical protein